MKTDRRTRALFSILCTNSPTILIPHHALAYYSFDSEVFWEYCYYIMTQFLLSAPKYSQTYPKNTVFVSHGNCLSNWHFYLQKGVFQITTIKYTYSISISQWEKILYMYLKMGCEVVMFCYSLILVLLTDLVT